MLDTFLSGELAVEMDRLLVISGGMRWFSEPLFQMLEKWYLRACRQKDATNFYLCCDLRGSDVAVHSASERLVECTVIICAD
jgi:hypothetical protein